MPPNPQKPSVILSVRLPKDIFDRLDRTAEQSSQSRNALATQAIIDWIESNEDEALRMALSRTIERATAERIDLYMRSYLSRIGDLVAATSFGSELSGVLAELLVGLHYGPERKDQAATLVQQARVNAAKRLKSRRFHG